MTPGARTGTRTGTRTSRQLGIYDSCARKLKRWRCWVGPGAERLATIPNRALTRLHLASVLVVAFGHVGYTYRERSERLPLLRGLGWTMGLSSVLFEAVSLTTRRDRLRDLDVELGLVFERDLTDETLRPFLLSPLSRFHRPAVLLVLSAWGIFVLTFLKPFLRLLVVRLRYGKLVHPTRPFAALYPWTVEPRTWRFTLVFIFELCVVVISAVIGSLTDALFSYCVFQISGQLRALAHRLGNLATSDDYRRDLRECATGYRRLADARRRVDQIYGPVILWQTVFNALTVCVLLYQFLHMSLRKTVVALTFMAMKLAQTFIHGWLGTCLTTESEDLREAVYSCDWPGSGRKRLANDVFVMLMYKPFVLTTCGIANVSVDLFVNVSNTALSYYFVLRAFDE